MPVRFWPKKSKFVAIHQDKFLNSVIDVLNDTDSLLADEDTRNEEAINEYKNFRSRRVMELLTQHASANNTSSDQFINDMKNLISGRNRLMDTPNNQSDEVKAEEWYLKLSALEKKYSVKDWGTEPDAITHWRLRLMFPQFLIGVPVTNFIFESQEIPLMFAFPEFGGLIPSVKSKELLGRDARGAIIIVHLFCLKIKSIRPSSLRLLYLLTEKGINESLLTDEKRCRLLEARGIINSAGKLTNRTFEVYEFISKNHSGFIKDVVEESKTITRIREKRRCKSKKFPFFNSLFSPKGRKS